MNDINAKAKRDNTVKKTIEILIPVQEQKLSKNLVKRKDESNNKGESHKCTNYYSLFSCYKSNKDNTDNNNKDRIEIIKYQ